MSRPLDALRISERTRRALVRTGYRTALELDEATDAELLGVRGIGKTSLAEIRRALAIDDGGFAEVVIDGHSHWVRPAVAVAWDLALELGAHATHRRRLGEAQSRAFGRLCVAIARAYGLASQADEDERAVLWQIATTVPLEHIAAVEALLAVRR